MFLNNHLRSPCKYYKEDHFAVLKKNKSGRPISFIHFNARGLRTNFNKIEHLLNEFESTFDVIAISEPWLESDDCTDVMIEGYEVRNVIRKNRKSGGAAIYINKSVNFKSMKCMSLQIDNIMKCVSIELCINRGKNIIVTCVYTTCGSSISAFSEQIQLLMQKVIKQQDSISLW